MSAPLYDLLDAKAHSDAGRYRLKSQILRRLISEDPQSWEIDERRGRFLGLTHTPTNFRIHMPASDVFPEMLEAEKQANLLTAGAKMFKGIGKGMSSGAKGMAVQAGLRPGFKDLLQARRKVNLVAPARNATKWDAPVLQGGKADDYVPTLDWVGKQPAESAGHFMTRGLGNKPTIYLPPGARQDTVLPFRQALRHESVHGIQNQLAGKFPLWSSTSIAPGNLGRPSPTRDLLAELQAYKAQYRSWPKSLREINKTWGYKAKGPGEGYHQAYYGGRDMPWYNPWRVAAGMGGVL